MSAADHESGRRRPGRPRTDSVDQRERLLDAAVLSFSERGIAATSLRALASEQGVTPAMLNYYFGSKRRLVETVVSERLLPILQTRMARMQAAKDADAAELAREFVTGMYAIIADNPWLPALWVREVLSDGGQLRGVFIDSIAPQLAIPLVERFRLSRDNGRLDRALDPRLLFVSLIGLTMLPFAAAPIWRSVFPADDLGPEQMLTHTLALLQRGVGP